MARPQDVAAPLRLSLGLVYRRLREAPPEGELTLPESAALVKLDRHGPSSPSALAKLEQISPQSMGATLTTLEQRGLVARTPHPDDRRSVVIALTPAGRKALGDKRAARTAQLADALGREFTDAELDVLAAATPLIERLAHAL
jgi:DNA-binding MarR family transcriptional regulator